MIKPIRILILEGSQNPPTFVGNLINGLLDNGCVVGLYGQEAKQHSQRFRSGNFSRVISRYSHINFVRLALDFCKIIVLNPRLLLDSRSLLTRSGNKKVDILRLFQLVKILKFNPDIIHVQWASHLEEVTTLLLYPARFKIVVSLRGKQINVTPVIDVAAADFYRQWFAKVTAFHAVSQAIARKALKFSAVSERMHVIYSGVPESFLKVFSEDDVFPRAPLKILSVGRFHWQKGYGYALEAMKMLKKKNVAFQYTIIAQGKIPDEIVHQLYVDKLNDCIRIVQGIPYHEMTEELKRHSVLLLPSLEEGIANVVLEAMAVGLPVVSTDCGGMREVVEPDETGILVSRRDAASMAHGLVRFQRMSDQDVKHLRIKAWQKVKTDFSQPRQIQKFVQLYQSLSRY